MASQQKNERDLTIHTVQMLYLQKINSQYPSPKES